MWAMGSTRKSDLPLDEQLEQIISAGFDGVNVEVRDRDRTRHIGDCLRDRGLSWSALCYPASVAELEPIVATAAEFGAREINLQPNVRMATIAEAVPYVMGWQRVADEAGMPLYFETHRDRMTNDLLFTLALINAIPAMTLTADLSHFVVGQEMQHPVSEENHRLVRLILDRTGAFHGRVGSSEQVQVQLEFAQHRPWLDLFLKWWEEGFRRWRVKAPDEAAALTFVTELGPPPYAITGADGSELSDRWEEALHLKDLVRGIWSRLEGVAPAV
jgi:hypothetical protein